MKITEMLAIYAAALSTAVFIWNIRRAIPRFKVEIIYCSESLEGEWLHGVCISVKNPSPYAVHLANISLLYPYKKVSLFEAIAGALKYRRFPITTGWVYSDLANYGIDHGFPLTIESGKSHAVLVSDAVLEKISEDSESNVIRAVVQDQLSRNKYSRKFVYT